MLIRKGRRIVADDEIEVKEEEVFEEEAPEEADVVVDPAATDLLFEAEDVAQLLAEVTNDVVEVSADEDAAVFTIGEGEDAEEFTVTADGDEEILEASRRVLRGKRQVMAARKPMAKKPLARRPIAKKPVVASRKAARPIRKQGR